VQTGYASIKRVAQVDDEEVLFFEPPNREVREVLMDEVVGFLFPQVNEESLKSYGRALLATRFEDARALLEQMLSALPVSAQPRTESQLSLYAFGLFTEDGMKKSLNLSGVYADTPMGLGDEDKRKAKRPDGVLVYRRNGVVHALVVELKYGENDTAESGADQIVRNEYVKRAIQYVALRHSLATIPRECVSEVCFHLSESMKVTMHVPPST
jgi:hypothetical protein